MIPHNHTEAASGRRAGCVMTTLFVFFLSFLAAPAGRLQAAGAAVGDSGLLLVTVYDGSRHPVAAGTDVLIRIFDGNQRELVSGYFKGPSVLFQLPVRDSLVDYLRVVVWTKGYKTEGFNGVQVKSGTTASVAVMLLPGKTEFVFQPWKTVRRDYPWLAPLLARGVAGESAAEARYNRLMHDDPGALAALLNITAATNQVRFGERTMLFYFQQVVWEEQRPEWRAHNMVGFSHTDDSEHTLRHDRFWAWADRRVVEQVKAGTHNGQFFPELFFQFWHPGATSSFKEKQMDEGHLHVSFYENDHRTIGGVDCILLEIHIDLYEDLLAHGLLEVLPDSLGNKVTEPEDAYQQRWNVAVNTGRPDFNPPYVIESFGSGRFQRHSFIIKQK